MRNYFSKRNLPLGALGAAVLSLGSLSATAETLVRTIPNTFGSQWEGEHVYFEFSPDEVDTSRPASLRIFDVVRPVQWEVVERDGEEIVKAWSYVTIESAEGRELENIEAHLEYREGEPGISMREEGDFLIINNGTYEFRVMNFDGDFEEPKKLGEVEHWLQGKRTLGMDGWDGDAYFESRAMTRGATTEVVAAGPVHIDLRVQYHFVDEGDHEELVEALPLELGKQTFKWEPNSPPRELVEKNDNHYEVMLRFVMDDLWVEANERFHFPRDPENEPWGITQYWIDWGEQDMPVDTVTWVRWFEYDRFGGNVDQNYVPAEPREAQRGRPFALLRPRWNQGGGGAQDFVLTSGGSPPQSIEDLIDGRRGILRRREYRNADEEIKAQVDELLDKAREEDRNFRERHNFIVEAGSLIDWEVSPVEETYSPDNPAMGVVAAFASKWVGPYPATIATYAHDGDRGNARFPLIDGERSEMHYGQRAYGLLIGPRDRMRSLNSIVRRHTDWTLNAEINKYILDWERDPEMAGPNMLISRKEYDQIKEDLAADRDTHFTRIVREAEEVLVEMEAELETVEARLEEIDDLIAEAEGEEKIMLEAEKEELDDQRGSLRRQIGDEDMDLVRLLVRGESRDPSPPSSGLWRARRYQDDFLNPTSRPTREVKNFAVADLYADGEPIGGADQAAFGYIATDLDSWPGYHQGWRPGNPNFHTDKYMAAIYIGGALRDHPHSDEWLEYGYENFREDLEKVIIAPDGVGDECPGYSGYATRLQLGIARILMNTGFGNPIADNPLFVNHGRWHRHLLTPYTTRLGMRHAAPIGDTHRWESGLRYGHGQLAKFYGEADPEFASEMMGIWNMLEEMGYRTPSRSPLRNQLIEMDTRIDPMDPMEMDWSSQSWFGFGSIKRTHFGTDRETFLSYKAGPARGHYHNDENSFHYIANNTPIAMNYNSSYSPRGDHAALHNSMTFGRPGTLRHNEDDYSFEALEQITSTAQVGAFVDSNSAAVTVSERTSERLQQYPTFPRDHEFNRDYPMRDVSPITHRRAIMMVKHPEDSRMTDYLVVRDETQTHGERQQVNIHLTARELTAESDRLFYGNGQWGKDMLVYFADVTNPRHEFRRWHYNDRWMVGPKDYVLQEGESIAEWEDRMQAKMDEHGVDSLPLPDFRPRWQHPDLNQDWFDLIEATEGGALKTPPFWDDEWKWGEIQLWLRVESDAGTPLLWVLYPYEKGSERPTIESLDNGRGVRVSLGDEVDEIFMDSEGGITVSQNGGPVEILVPADTLPELGEISGRDGWRMD
ncbi:MAG: hypothetical protein JJT75_01800 [Opitutales bacterium]|nr:hypothetical protein [Opitutales bacterium]MCH8540641.1 hypothetical protein [Opitutales bacterium]